MPKYHKSVTVSPPGEYEVQVVSALDKVSAAGNEMIVLKLSVQDSPSLFSDHLVFTETSSWKIEQFLAAMGEELEDGKEIKAADYVGRSARAVVGVEEVYRLPKNKIEKWLIPAGPPSESLMVPETDPLSILGTEPVA